MNKKMKIIEKGMLITGIVFWILCIVDKCYAIDGFSFSLGVIMCMFIDLMFEIFVGKSQK